LARSADRILTWRRVPPPQPRFIGLQPHPGRALFRRQSVGGDV